MDGISRQWRKSRNVGAKIITSIYRGWFVGIKFVHLGNYSVDKIQEIPYTHNNQYKAGKYNETVDT